MQLRWFPPPNSARDIGIQRETETEREREGGVDRGERDSERGRERGRDSERGGERGFFLRTQVYGQDNSVVWRGCHSLANCYSHKPNNIVPAKLREWTYLKFNNTTLV